MIKTQFFILLVVLILAIDCVKYSTTFDQGSDNSPYEKEIWEKDFTIDWASGATERSIQTSEYFKDGYTSIRIEYPQGGVGPSEGGSQVSIALQEEDQYYMSYWMMFSEDFSFGSEYEGGKLPGLASSGLCSGCVECSGENGFTARMMWRTGGGIVLYLYHMDKSNNCGDNYELKYNSTGEVVTFTRNKWYHIMERVKINSGSNNDGEVEVWINNEHVLLVENLKFVTNGAKVDKLYFSTFHGGSTEEWAPQNTCYIFFDKLTISTEKSDCEADLSTEDTTNPAVGLKVSMILLILLFLKLLF
ncbi:hypothetical protein M0813_01579 [Anaeramoeba flamelloides]|uniref:Polysaccharide lyase 14 domain-containing protein n=1 Tax=Anaeramoeba flamelloides TaxID=1746091 RepID=A0ABQ8Z4I1_9EUKA|nr:hypothetical protein M0813_01579 [Anaeramoeba flamelloides]